MSSNETGIETEIDQNNRNRLESGSKTLKMALCSAPSQFRNIQDEIGWNGMKLTIMQTIYPQVLAQLVSPMSFQWKKIEKILTPP